MVNVNNVVAIPLFSICPGTSLCRQLHCKQNNWKSFSQTQTASDSSYSKNSSFSLLTGVNLKIECPVYPVRKYVDKHWWLFLKVLYKNIVCNKYEYILWCIGILYKCEYALVCPAWVLFLCSISSNYRQIKTNYIARRHTADCILLRPKHNNKLLCSNKT